TEAQSGIDNLATRFPEMGGTAGQVVFVADDGAPIEEHQAQIDDVMAEIGDIEGVEAAPSPFDDLSPGTRSDDGTAMIFQFQMDSQNSELPDANVAKILKMVTYADGAELEAYLGGEVRDDTEIPFNAD